MWPTTRYGQRSRPCLDGRGRLWQRAEVPGRAVKCWHAPMNSRTWREEGKTLIEARGEVVRAGQILKYYAGPLCSRTVRP